MFIHKLAASAVTSALLFSGGAEAKEPPLPEARASTIGYATPAEALAALRSNPAVTVREQGGWTVAEDSANRTLWSFPPPEHPAYPSAVRRQLWSGPDGTSIDLDVICGASKEACDDLVRAFQALNERMAQSPRGK